MATDEFEIVDGVRRAKASCNAGRVDIIAQELKDGRLGPPQMVRLDTLRSPHKNSIDVSSTPTARRRWMRCVVGAQQDPLPFPPIIVRRSKSHKGPRIQDVQVL